MSLKFGTSGLRGLAADLRGRASARYALAFAHHMQKTGALAPGGRVLIGLDFRDSSPDISLTVAGALADAGFQPIDCGPVPTPALALKSLTEACPALMITGSHIPADRNGIKFYRPDGEIDKTDELAIAAEARLLEDAALPSGTSAVHGRNEHLQTLAAFRARNEGLLPPGTLTGMTIGVYQHSTVARDLFVDIVRALGAEVLAFGRSDHFIPVDTEAVSAETLALLAATAKAQKLDAIVSADGDGDRPLVADEEGRPLRGDLLGLITARFLGARVVVTPVTSNSGIESAIAGTVIRTRVGSPYVIEGMQEALRTGETAVMGFEANGGLLTASPFTLQGKVLAPLPTRDCFLPTLAVLASAKASGRSLKALSEDFNLPVADADRLESFPLESSAGLMAWLRESAAHLSDFVAPLGKVRSISDIDGLRVTLDDGSIVHLRPSGNAPEMRCYVEAKDEKAAKTLLHKGLERIAAFRQLHG